ncbi:MAG: ATP-binding protein [Saprospiraceae bacterium]|nr:ATP-binding protein [Saprospiraceae bacterium]
MSNNISDPILNAIQCQYNAILVTGSNLFDLQVEVGNSTDLFYRPLYIAEKLFEMGYHVLRYSRSAGFSVHKYSQVKDKSSLDTILKNSGIFQHLGSNSISPTEVIEIFRAFKKIASAKHQNPFVIIVDYVPHLASQQSPTIEERIVAETLNDIASLPAVKKSANILVVYAHEDGNISSLLKGLYKVSYGYPTSDEYEQFINIISNRPNEFGATDADIMTIAKLSRGLTLSQIANLFIEAKSKDKKVTISQINEEKRRLIEQVSENTLKVLPTDITFDDIAGIDVPKRIFLDFAEKLKNQDSASPKAILAAGPPGTGKSALASAFANACGFNLVELSDQIKSMWVGESESRLNLALSLIEALAPVVLFIDEFDQAFSSRSQANLDGGVSSHYLKTLMKWLGDDSKRGKIVIYACSNTPQLLDPAMINRFITVPLLEATPIELAHIFPKIEKGSLV